jgi:hypothetical protein
MNSEKSVNIDFKKMGETFHEFVRSKALLAGSTIVYVLKGKLVEEDPRTNEIKILADPFISK